MLLTRLYQTWHQQRAYLRRKQQRSRSCAGQVHRLTVKVISKSECQFPSLESASQLSQSQFGAPHQHSIEVPFSEIWSHKMLLEMSNPWGISSICWFIQSLVISNSSSTWKMDISTHNSCLHRIPWWQLKKNNDIRHTARTRHVMSAVTVNGIIQILPQWRRQQLSPHGEVVYEPEGGVWTGGWRGAGSLPGPSSKAPNS